MPDNETVTLKTKWGEDIDVVVPGGMSDAEVKTFVLSKRPDLFQSQPPTSSGRLVQLPDGSTASFPGEMSDDDISTAIQNHLNQSAAVPRTFQDMMNRIIQETNKSKQQLMQSSSNPANAPQRAMQQSMGGPPQFVDVPAGQKQKFEQAGQQGYQTGGKVGAGLVAGAGVAGALALPTAAAAETVGTGILDASGDEIMREVAKYGPSLGKQALQSTLSWVGRHKLISGALYEGARRAGVPLPNVIGWLAKAAGEVK